MAREHWAVMTVPKEFRDIIKDIVQHRRYGYTSVPEVTGDALRRLLLELGALHWDMPTPTGPEGPERKREKPG
jgi:hypothetical protein